MKILDKFKAHVKQLRKDHNVDALVFNVPEIKTFDGNDLIELGWKLERLIKADHFRDTGAVKNEEYTIHKTMELSIYYDKDNKVVLTFFKIHYSGGVFGKEVNFRTKQDVATFMQLFKI